MSIYIRQIFFKAQYNKKKTIKNKNYNRKKNQSKNDHIILHLLIL